MLKVEMRTFVVHPAPNRSQLVRPQDNFCLGAVFALVYAEWRLSESFFCAPSSNLKLLYLSSSFLEMEDSQL